MEVEVACTLHNIIERSEANSMEQQWYDGLELKIKKGQTEDRRRKRAERNAADTEFALPDSDGSQRAKLIRRALVQYTNGVGASII